MAEDIKDPLAQGFGQMMQSDPDYLDLQRRQLMAKTLMEHVMAAQGGATYRKSPIAVALDYLSLRNGKSAEDAASAGQRDIYNKTQAQQQQESQAFQQGVLSNDPRAAIAAAMSSRFPQIQKMGQEYLKTNSGNFEQVLKAIPDKLTVPSILSSAGGGGNAGGLQASPPPASPQLIESKDSTGVVRPAWQTQNPKGDYDVKPITEPIKINNTLNNGPEKVMQHVIEQQAGWLSPGGKGYEQAQALQKGLGTTTDILQTLNENPQMGAGATGLQTFRKWAETLGGQPIELTGSTEQMKAQLMANVINTLGGLGNQVSDADRKAMQDALGSLDTNPAALRRLMLISMKYQMKGLNQLSTQAEQLNAHPLLKDSGVPFPGLHYGVQLNTGDANDLESLFNNKLPPLRIPNLKPPSGLPPGVRAR